MRLCQRGFNGKPCENEQECRLCWLYWNNEEYRTLWDADTPQEIIASYKRDIIGEPPKTAVRRCMHLGEFTGKTETCGSCNGHVEIKLMSCAVYGLCTTHKALPNMACCAGCHRFVQKV